jgi:hypothetical protein
VQRISSRNAATAFGVATGRFMATNSTDVFNVVSNSLYVCCAVVPKNVLLLLLLVL